MEVIVLSVKKNNDDLISKDVVSKATKALATVNEMFSKVDELPKISRAKASNENYLKVIQAIAKMKKGTYKLDLEKIEPNVKKYKDPIKSVYPNIDRYLRVFASQHGYNIEKYTVKGKTTTGREIREYPELEKFRNEVMRIRVANKQIYLEKMTDKVF